MQCCRHSASEHFHHTQRMRLECDTCKDYRSHDPYDVFEAAQALAWAAFGIAMKKAKVQWKEDLEKIWALQAPDPKP